jgi:AraC-like DNA-binding protein
MKAETFASIRLPNFSARVMRSALVEIGADWQSWLERAGLDENAIDDAFGLITGAQELLLQEAFMRETADVPELWFRTGQQYRLIGYGPLGVAALAAKTFTAGLKVISAYRDLTFALIDTATLSDNGRHLSIVFDDRQVPNSCREFNQERGLSATIRIVSDMHPGISPIARVDTVLQEREDRKHWEDELGFPFTFGAPATRVVFRNDVRDALMPMADSLIQQTYSTACSKAIRDAGMSDPVSRLRQLLKQSAPHYPTALEAGTKLGLSERTLYRRLADQGLTFGTLLERVRTERAITMLESTDGSIETIAFKMGFSEASSFSRAFKRWTGSSPLAYRHRSARPTAALTLPT